MARSNPKELILNQALKASPNQSWSSETPEQLVSLSASHLSQSESVFAKEDLFAHALALSRGKFLLSDIEKGLDHLVESGELLRLDQPKVNQEPLFERLTTREIYQIEHQAVDTILKGRNAVKPLVRIGEVEASLNGAGLSAGQEAAVRLMLLSPDRYGLIQGDGGTGKTTSVDKVRQILEKYWL